MKRTFLLAAVTALATGAALAAPNNEPLTAEVMRKELFGVRLTGIVVQTGTPWSECIEPNGRTLYRIEGGAREGRLTITDEAQACFTYPETGKSCFRGQRSPRGYLFYSVGGGATFSVTKVERGVKECVASDFVS
jgi:hypothetical protein